MKPTDPEIHFTSLIESGRQMLECARTDDWEAVSRLQRQCHQLAQELFKESVPAAEVPTAAASIREVLKINDEIAELGVNARNVCQKNMRSLQQSRQAAKAYSDNII